MSGFGVVPSVASLKSGDLFTRHSGQAGVIPAFARKREPESTTPSLSPPFVGDGRDRPLRWGIWIPPVEEWLIFHGAGMTDLDS